MEKLCLCMSCAGTCLAAGAPGRVWACLKSCRHLLWRVGRQAMHGAAGACRLWRQRVVFCMCCELAVQSAAEGTHVITFKGSLMHKRCRP